MYFLLFISQDMTPLMKMTRLNKQVARELLNNGIDKHIVHQISKSLA